MRTVPGLDSPFLCLGILGYPSVKSKYTEIEPLIFYFEYFQRVDLSITIEMSHLQLY